MAGPEDRALALPCRLRQNLVMTADLDDVAGGDANAPTDAADADANAGVTGRALAATPIRAVARGSADAPAEAPAARATLEYDKSAGRVSRRQMNLLLLFVAVDTILFAGFVCLPAMQPAMRDWLAQYQRGRDERRRVAALD